MISADFRSDNLRKSQSSSFQAVPSATGGLYSYAVARDMSSGRWPGKSKGSTRRRSRSASPSRNSRFRAQTDFGRSQSRTACASCSPRSENRFSLRLDLQYPISARQTPVQKEVQCALEKVVSFASCLGCISYKYPIGDSLAGRRDGRLDLSPHYIEHFSLRCSKHDEGFDRGEISSGSPVSRVARAEGSSAPPTPGDRSSPVFPQSPTDL